MTGRQNITYSAIEFGNEQKIKLVLSYILFTPPTYILVTQCLSIYIISSFLLQGLCTVV